MKKPEVTSQEAESFLQRGRWNQPVLELTAPKQRAKSATLKELADAIAALRARVEILEQRAYVLPPSPPEAPALAQRQRANAQALVDHALDLVCTQTGVPRTVVLGDTRPGRVVYARHAVCYLTRTCTVLSYAEIGMGMGFDHGTIQYAMRKMSDRVDTEPQVRADIGAMQAAYRKLLAHYGLAGGSSQPAAISHQP
jgi:hypothetical protein